MQEAFAYGVICMTGINCSICGQPNASQAKRNGIYCANCYSAYVIK